MKSENVADIERGDHCRNFSNGSSCGSPIYPEVVAVVNLTSTVCPLVVFLDMRGVSLQ